MPKRSFPSLSKLSVYDLSPDSSAMASNPAYPTAEKALIHMFKTLQDEPIAPIETDVFEERGNGLSVYTSRTNPATGEPVFSSHFTTHNGYYGTFSLHCMPCEVVNGMQKKQLWRVALQLKVKVYGYEDHEYFNDLFQTHAAKLFSERVDRPFESVPLIQVAPRTTRLGFSNNFKLSFSPSLGLLRLDTVCVILDIALRRAINEADQDFLHTWNERRPPASQTRVPWLSG